MTHTSPIGRLWRLFRQASPLLILAACALVLWPRIQSLDFTLLQSHWRTISASQWVLSGVLTIISFWAVGQYDVIAHRQLDTGMPPEQARRSGMTAIALSQTLGFGVFTATLARWRMFRGYGPGVAALVTGVVSLTFMVMILAISAVLVSVLPAPSLMWGLGLITPIAIFAVLLGAFFKPRLRIKGHVIDLPSLRALWEAACWAFVDVVAACLALWILIPGDARPEVLTLLPVFCVALSAGLLSGTPGGAGPFELTLLAMTSQTMPAHTPEAALLVAIFGFRLVYFAVPAVLAVCRLLVRPAPMAVWRDPLPPDVSFAPRAESAVIRQTGGEVEQFGQTFASLWRTGQACVAMFDPFDHADEVFLERLQSRAQSLNRVALLYKSGRRTAYAARRAGWQVLHSADDAILNARHYTADVPERSGLRRKLRKAEKSDVTTRRARIGDFPRLSDIDSHWQSLHGTARGGTMGRFCRAYLMQQHVLVAEKDGRIIAFASFHKARQEWALDLMRHTDSLPDGTMHLLVHRGIEDAQKALIPQVSLAAVPACPDPQSAIWRAIMFRLVAFSGGRGLRQFKSSFAPAWKPLYMAAPSRTALLIGIADVMREVFLPTELTASQIPIVSQFHDEDENYEVVSQAAA